MYAAHAVLFFVAGLLIGRWTGGDWTAGLWFGASLLVWGVLVRTILVWHITWSVNSLTHLIGYRNYDTNENSRNSWLVALVTVGEGWHNNHHHDQASASNQAPLVGTGRELLRDQAARKAGAGLGRGAASAQASGGP